MILVDTSVLIDWMKNTNTAQTDLLNIIIERRIPYGISAYTYMETLQGIRNEHDYKKVQAYLSSLRIYYLPEDINKYDKSAKLYARLRRQGVTPRSAIDILIALTAIENNLSLLHSDKDFDTMAEKIPELKILSTELPYV